LGPQKVHGPPPPLIDALGGAGVSVSKEAVLRSRVRIEMRQWQMQRRHPLKWGERQQIEVKDDFSRLTIEERMQKVAELLSPRPGD
jgi:hypothetical protein